MNPSLAHQEHEELSPSFLAWLVEMGGAGHPQECGYCFPVTYDSGKHETRNAYTRSVDCPYCDQQVKSIGLVEVEYAKHLDVVHEMPWMAAEIKQHGVRDRLPRRENRAPIAGRTCES